MQEFCVKESAWLYAMPWSEPNIIQQQSKIRWGQQKSSCKWHNPPQKFQNTSWQFQPTYSHTATWQFAFSCPIISPCWEVMSHQTSPAFPAGLHSCQKNTHRHTVAADLPRELNKSAFHQVGSCPKTAEMGHTSRFQMSCMLNKA